MARTHDIDDALAQAAPGQTAAPRPSALTALVQGLGNQATAQQLARSPVQRFAGATPVLARAKLPGSPGFTRDDFTVDKFELPMDKPMSADTSEGKVHFKSGQVVGKGSVTWKKPPDDPSKQPDPNAKPSEDDKLKGQVGFVQQVKHSRRQYVYTKDGLPTGEVLATVHEGTPDNAADQQTRDVGAGSKEKGRSVKGPFYSDAAMHFIEPGRSESFTLDDEITFDLPIERDCGAKGKGYLGKTTGGDEFNTAISVVGGDLGGAPMHLDAKEWRVPTEMTFDNNHKATVGSKNITKDKFTPDELNAIKQGTGNAVVDSIRYELPTNAAEADALGFIQKLKMLQVLRGSSDPAEATALQLVRDSLTKHVPRLHVKVHISTGVEVFRENVYVTFNCGDKKVKRSQYVFKNAEVAVGLNELLGDGWLGRLEAGERPPITVEVGGDEGLKEQSMPWPYPWDPRGTQVLTWKDDKTGAKAGESSDSVEKQEKAAGDHRFQFEVDFLGLKA